MIGQMRTIRTRLFHPNWVMYAARISMCLFLGSVTWISLIPTEKNTSALPIDKGLHAAAFIVFVGILCLAWRRLNPWWILIMATIYGLCIELAQGLMGIGRTASLWDVLANQIGIFIGFGVFVMLYSRLWPQNA